VFYQENVFPDWSDTLERTETSQSTNDLFGLFRGYSSPQTSAGLVSVLNEQYKEEMLTELVRGYGNVRSQ
jgi:hypothetical protein